ALSFLVLGVCLQVASALYLGALLFGGTRLAAALRRRRALSAGATSAAGARFLGFAAKLSLASAEAPHAAPPKSRAGRGEPRATCRRRRRPGRAAPRTPAPRRRNPRPARD